MDTIIALESLYILDQPAEFLATNEELMEQADVLESFAAGLEDDLLYECAMEAANGEDADESPSQISAKFRSGFDKIKKGKRSKNQTMISEGQREVKEASDDLKDAERNADTPEKKKKLNTVAKVAIAVGGAALLAILTYVGVKNKDKIVGVIKKLKRNPGNSIAQTVSDVNSAASIAVNTPVEDTNTMKQKAIDERKAKADQIRTERARKKELRDWYLFAHGDNKSLDFDKKYVNDAGVVGAHSRNELERAFSPEGKKSARQRNHFIANYRRSGHEAFKRYDKKVIEYFNACHKYLKDHGVEYPSDLNRDDRAGYRVLKDAFDRAVRLRNNSTTV